MVGQVTHNGDIKLVRLDCLTGPALTLDQLMLQRHLPRSKARSCPLRQMSPYNLICAVQYGGV